MLCSMNIEGDRLFEGMEKLEYGTLKIEGICCAITPYWKCADVVSDFAADVRKNLREWNYEVSMKSYLNGWGECRFWNNKVFEILDEMEDTIRDMQRIVVSKENDVVETIAKEMEVTVSDAMCLVGLRKMLTIINDMLNAVLIMESINSQYFEYVESAGDDDD